MPQSAPDQSQTARHFPVLDWLRAVAIVAVVVHHAAHFFTPPVTPLDTAILWAIGFDVPLLFMLSGFLLTARPPLRVVDLKRRLRRILPPYLVASLIIYVAGWSSVSEASSLPAALLFGGTLNIYYFVFLLVTFLGATFVLSYLPLAASFAVLLAIWAYKLFLIVSPWSVLSLDWFWAMRDPVRTYDFFLLGWLARRIGPQWWAWAVRKTIVPAAVAAGIVVLHTIYRWQTAGFSSVDYTIKVAYSVAAATVLLAIFRDRKPTAAVRWLSRSSYFIYLYHWPFVMAADARLAEEPALLRIFLATAAGLAGSAAVGEAVRFLAPRHADLLVGISHARESG